MSLSLSKQERMQLFLTKNYKTLSELSEDCAVGEEKILSLEKAQCIPGHTYEMRQLCIYTCAGIDTPLTENTDLSTTWYYHASIASWVKEALVMEKKMDTSEIALQVKNDFSKQLKKVLGNIKTPGCQSFDQAWNYWIDGTWGKCLKEISLKCLVKKELSRHRIAQIMEHNPEEISVDVKTELSSAIKNYISASLDFDTYGMRHILAEEAIEKFQLDIAIDKQYLRNS
jgi:hypothetical protein